MKLMTSTVPVENVNSRPILQPNAYTQITIRLTTFQAAGSWRNKMRRSFVDKHDPRFSDQHPVGFSWRELSFVVIFCRFAPFGPSFVLVRSFRPCKPII